MNGACPIHWLPSPPICVRPVTALSSRPDMVTSVWQPIPPPPMEPSGIAVERLWGHPLAEVRGSLGGKHVERQRGREGALELDVRLQYAAQRGEQPACGQFTTGRHEQTALAVTLADDARGIVGAVQDFPDLSFDERGLVLDHDDLLEAFGELLDLLAHDGVAHSDAKETDPGAVQCGIIDAEVCQSLTDGVESCTGGGDTDLRTGGVDLDHIEVVGSSVRVHKIPSRAVQIGLGDDTVRRRGHLTLLVDEGLALELHFRNHDVEVRDAAVDRPGTVCDVGDDLQRYDATGRHAREQRRAYPS